MRHSAVAPYEALFSRPTREVLTDLEHYEALLRKWQPAQNLVSRETLDDLWTRHFADSLQVGTLLTDRDRTIVDLGSGGGFPALPLAIASKGTGRTFVLVEPNSRKASFLRTVSRELRLAAEVATTRIELLDSRETRPPDVFTSRALAPLDVLCGWMVPHFGPSTRAILHKGREHVEELAKADSHWRFDVLTQRSDTDPHGVLLTLTNLARREP